MSNHASRSGLVDVRGDDGNQDDQEYDSDQTEDKLLPSGAILEWKSNEQKIMEEEEINSRGKYQK